MFEKALRAFDMGGLSFSDLRLAVERQLADGAPPEELLRVMQRRELIEPLPQTAHGEILAILQGGAADGDGGTESIDDSSAVPHQNVAEPDFDEVSMSGLLQTLRSEWAAEPPDTSALTVEIKTMRVALDTRNAELASLRDDHSRVLGLLEARARSVQQLEADLRKHAVEFRSAKEALQLQQNMNRELSEALAEKLAASEVARARDAEVVARSEAASRNAERQRVELAASQEAAAASDAALHEAHRALEVREADLQQARRALDARESALEQMRYSLGEHEAALDQARQLVSERDALIASLQQKQAEAPPPVESDLHPEKIRADLQAALEHTAALDNTLLLERTTALERTSALEAALDQARLLVSERDGLIGSLQQRHAEALRPLESGAQSEKLRAELQAALEHTSALDHTFAMERTSAQERTFALEADLLAAHAALGAEQNKARRFDAVLAENNSLLAEKNTLLADKHALLTERDTLLKARTADAGDRKAFSSNVSTLQRTLEQRTAELAAQRQEHAKALPAFASRIKNLESELSEARQRIEALTAALNTSRARATSRAAPESTKPAVEVREFSPARVIPRKIDIKEFALSPPLNWLRNRFVRAAAICLLVIAAGIGIRSIIHHSSAAKAPDANSALPGTVIRDCEACPALTGLPAGRFKQGSGDSNASASVKPAHWVSIAQPFAMSINDVTVAEFQAFASATGRDMQGCDVYDGQWKHQQASGWQSPGFEQTALHPVTCVSWDDAKAYAQWLSAQTGHHYRLPSASEWEFAARAGGEAPQPWGSNGADACANANVADSSAAHRFPGWVAFACNDGYVFTSPVGTFKPNAFGLNDMLGNVFQWTEDCWNADYSHAPIDGSARAEGNCAEHELRGGSWFSYPEFVRPDYRNHFAADYRASSIGIRLVRDLNS